MIDGRPWCKQCLYKVGKTMAETDGDYLKIDDEPNSWEGITKQLLAGGDSDVKENLQPKCERCRNTSVE